MGISESARDVAIDVCGVHKVFESDAARVEALRDVNLAGSAGRFRKCRRSLRLRQDQPDAHRR